MNTINIIGKKIKQIRKIKGMTQEQLAARLNIQGLNIDRIMISKIENHKRPIYDYEIKAISKSLSVSIQELFNE